MQCVVVVSYQQEVTIQQIKGGWHYALVTKHLHYALRSSIKCRLHLNHVLMHLNEKVRRTSATSVKSLSVALLQITDCTFIVLTISDLFLRMQFLCKYVRLFLLC